MVYDLLSVLLIYPWIFCRICVILLLFVWYVHVSVAVCLPLALHDIYFICLWHDIAYSF